MSRPEIGVYARGYDRHNEYRQGKVIEHSAINPSVFFLKGFGESRIYRMLSGKALSVQPMPMVAEGWELECDPGQDAIAVLNRKRLELIKCLT